MSSLNDMTLNPQVLSALYSRLLVCDSDGVEPVAVSKTSEDTVIPAKKGISQKKQPIADGGFKSLGNNQKNVLVGVRYQDCANLPDAQLEFLTQLLKACQLSLMDVAIINLNNYPDMNSDEVLSHFHSKIIILFGIKPLELGFPFEIPEYQVQPFAGRTVIHSPDLEDIQDDKTAKSKLWTGLKRMFDI